MGSVPQTLVGTAPRVPGPPPASQKHTLPLREAGTSEARCAGERAGSPSNPSAQRPLQTRPALARRREQTGREGSWDRMAAKKTGPVFSDAF